MSQMISRGSGAATSVTRSKVPSPERARDRADDTTDAATRSTSSTSPAMRLGVNACAASRRILVWRGASMLIRDPKNSCASAGRSRIETAPSPEQNSSGFRLTWSTSAWRLIARKPGPVGKPANSGSSYMVRGPSVRRAANAA